jgi:hypothetical protein
LRDDFFADDFFVDVDFRRDEDFFADDFFRDDDFFRGTLAPFSRASESPIAIACLRLFTVPPFPPRPRFSEPFLRRRIALSTRFPAAFP